MWSKYDTDNNGYLDKEEVQQYVTASLKEIKGADYTPLPDSEMEEIFKTYDKDGSGRIDKQEMCMFIRQKAGVPESHCNHYDKDGKA